MVIYEKGIHEGSPDRRFEMQSRLVFQGSSNKRLELAAMFGHNVSVFFGYYSLELAFPEIKYRFIFRVSGLGSDSEVAGQFGSKNEGEAIQVILRGIK